MTSTLSRASSAANARLGDLVFPPPKSPINDNAFSLHVSEIPQALRNASIGAEVVEREEPVEPLFAALSSAAVPRLQNTEQGAGSLVQGK